MKGTMKISFIASAILFTIVLAGCAASPTEQYKSILQNSTTETIMDDLDGLVYRSPAKDYSDSEWREFFDSDEVSQATYDFALENAKNGDFEKLSHFVSGIELTINVADAESSSTVDGIVNGLSDGFKEFKAADLSAVPSSLESIRGLGSQLKELDITLGQCGLGLTIDDLKQIYQQDSPEVLTEGMEGYYSDPENMEEDVHVGSTATYKEGFGSALKDAQRDATWTYYGDFAVKKTVTARDALTNKPGEPVNFTYDTDYGVFHCGEQCNLPSNLDDAQVFGDGQCFVFDDYLYFQKEDDPSSYLRIDTIN